MVDAERGEDARDGGAEGDFDQPVVGGERAALEVHGSLLQLFLDRIGDFRELLGDVRLLGVRPSRRLAAESRGLEFGQGDLAAGTHLQKRAGGQGFERDDAAAALDGERADLTGIPGLGGAGLRRAQRQQGDEAGGGGGLGAALQEAEERDPEVDQQAEGHERHGDVGQEPTGVAHDLQDADVLAGGGVAEAGLVEGHAAVAERLVHRDVEGEGAAPSLDGHVAGEAAGNLGARVLLVREAVEADAEGQVGAGAAERELVFAAGVLEGLRGEGFRQLGVKQPDADGLAVGDELQERARDVADVVVEAFGQALERQRRTGGDALRGGDVGAIGHLRLRAEHGVRVVELDLGLEGRAGERELRLGVGHRAEQRIGDGHDLFLAGVGAVDEGDLELAEGFGVGPAFAFGDDHRGFFLARGGDKPADQQQHEAAVNERDAGVADAQLEVAEVRADEVQDEQGAQEESTRERQALAELGVERVGAVPGTEVFLLHVPHAPVDLFEGAEQDQHHRGHHQPNGQLQRGQEVEPGGAGFRFREEGFVHGIWEAARNLRKAADCAFTASRSPENLKNHVEPFFGTMRATMAF